MSEYDADELGVAQRKLEQADEEIERLQFMFATAQLEIERLQARVRELEDTIFRMTMRGGARWTGS